MDARELWDRQASTFDDEPDHGLGDPATREAWRDLLLTVLPPPPARIADLGCGTGTLSVLLAEQGFDVHGVDVSPEMVSRAASKADAAGVEASFRLGDVAAPELDPAAYDVVLCRHVLWAMSNPSAAVARWLGLLRPGGSVVMVEGQWSTGGGLTATEVRAIVEGAGLRTEVRPMPEPVYWGKEIVDERYLLVSRT